MKLDRVLLSALITGFVLGGLAVTIIDSHRAKPLLVSLQEALRHR